jgi:hypothetical protein
MQGLEINTKFSLENLSGRDGLRVVGKKCKDNIKIDLKEIWCEHNE